MQRLKLKFIIQIITLHYNNTHLEQQQQHSTTNRNCKSSKVIIQWTVITRSKYYTVPSSINKFKPEQRKQIASSHWKQILHLILKQSKILVRKKSPFLSPIPRSVFHFRCIFYCRRLPTSSNQRVCRIKKKPSLTKTAFCFSGSCLSIHFEIPLNNILQRTRLNYIHAVTIVINPTGRQAGNGKKCSEEYESGEVSGLRKVQQTWENKEKLKYISSELLWPFIRFRKPKWGSIIVVLE